MQFYIVRQKTVFSDTTKKRYYRSLDQARSAVCTAMKDCGTPETVTFNGTSHQQGKTHYEHWESTCGRWVITLATRTFESEIA